MRKILLLSITAFFIMLGSCNKESIQLPQDEDQNLISLEDGDIIPGQYIVLLKEGVTSVRLAKLSYPDGQILMRKEIQKILALSNVPEKELLQVYTAAVEGFAVKLSEGEASILESNPGVRGIWPDRMIILKKPSPDPIDPPEQPTQEIPWGITRVGGGVTYTESKVWIIDTGIDLNHPDLNVNQDLDKTYVKGTKTADDDNGHGTHCAGIVAAINNLFGVVGVAACAEVVPVKVLNSRGSGFLSTIIAGVDYVAANGSGGDAVNMSLGGGIYKPLDEAVIAMGAKGLFVALAAGNEGEDADNHSPARASDLLLYSESNYEGVSNIYAISACASSEEGDIWASFSNYGNAVDFCAPGVNIYSTYKGGAYATMSGTSMAAPHACGVLLVTNGNPNTDGYVSGDPDEESGDAPDPIIHTGYTVTTDN